jgi:hypothetical protein
MIAIYINGKEKEIEKLSEGVSTITYEKIIKVAGFKGNQKPSVVYQYKRQVVELLPTEECVLMDGMKFEIILTNNA